MVPSGMEARMTPKRLYKSRTERMIDGVCGGLAEFFNLDVTLVRIAWVLLTLVGLSIAALNVAALQVAARWRIDVNRRLLHERAMLMGTATADDFDRYRVLVGRGINPGEWITVGNEPIDPVTDGILATWDTTGLSGLYAIQLQVLHADSRVETAIIQVTVGG